jgi:hypothetical protein
MRKKDADDFYGVNSLRRDFNKKTCNAVSGLLVAPYIKPSGIFLYEHKQDASYLTAVAITVTTNTPAVGYIYDDAGGGDKQKVYYILNLLEQTLSGMVKDLFSKEKELAIKINMTRCSINAAGFKLNKFAKFPDYTITEAKYTHPEVLQGVGRFIIDAGANPADFYIVDSLWDSNWQTYVSTAPFGFNDGFVYNDVKKTLGCNIIYLNDKTAANRTNISTGNNNYYNFSSFSVNKIWQEVDVYVSIPKIKHHSAAGLTCSLKNQIGITHKELYTINNDNERRGTLHQLQIAASEWNYLPETVCDLHDASSVLLAVLDAIKCSTGVEGFWCTNFNNVTKHAQYIAMKIYDVTGGEEESLNEGAVFADEYRLQWSAEGFANGIYFCRIAPKDFSETIKMIYQK